jgi:hypothetical protein
MKSFEKNVCDAMPRQESWRQHSRRATLALAPFLLSVLVLPLSPAPVTGQSQAGAPAQNPIAPASKSGAGTQPATQPTAQPGSPPAGQASDLDKEIQDQKKELEATRKDLEAKRKTAKQLLGKEQTAVKDLRRVDK